MDSFHSIFTYFLSSRISLRYPQHYCKAFLIFRLPLNVFIVKSIFTFLKQTFIYFN
uniref:Uncharacterized protein n=1 Tax=Meloidogyne enterolobii TaxID=390850 RepID=A0A6V7V2U5_MELEN|nr:unnamed protein product [Meloidogyne enterolobii]